jgi:hypothetical protein
MMCPKHNEEMVPVSWMKRGGIAISTAYACESCIREREPGDPIKILEGPIDHSLDDADSPYKFGFQVVLFVDGAHKCTMKRRAIPRVGETIVIDCGEMVRVMEISHQWDDESFVQVNSTAVKI